MKCFINSLFFLRLLYITNGALNEGFFELNSITVVSLPSMFACEMFWFFNETYDLQKILTLVWNLNRTNIIEYVRIVQEIYRNISRLISISFNSVAGLNRSLSSTCHVWKLSDFFLTCTQLNGSEEYILNPF